MIRKLIFLVVSLFLVSCGDGFTYQQKKDRYDRYISKADSLLQIEEYKGALKYANSAIEMTDTLSLGFIKKGQANYGLSFLSTAEKNFDKALKIEGKSSKVYKLRALVHLKNKDSDFLDDINVYLESYPNDEEAIELRRNYYENENHYKEAINEYNLAIEKFKDSVELYVKRSEMYVQNGDYDEAMSDYNKILSIRPDSPEIVSKSEFLESKIHLNKNRNILIVILTAIFIAYIFVSHFILKPLVIKKVKNQIGGVYTVGKDRIPLILPFVFLITFFVLSYFELIPNF